MTIAEQIQAAIDSDPILEHQTMGEFIVEAIAEYDEGNARDLLVAAGWRPDADGKWWRDGCWATARVGLVNVKAIISPAEARAFAVLAERRP